MIHLTDSEALAAAHAVATEIERLRDDGFDVQVVQDLGPVAIVRVRSEDATVQMMLDPMRLMKRLTH